MVPPPEVFWKALRVMKKNSSMLSQDDGTEGETAEPSPGFGFFWPTGERTSDK